MQANTLSLLMGRKARDSKLNVCWKQEKWGSSVTVQRVTQELKDGVVEGDGSNVVGLRLSKIKTVTTDLGVEWWGPGPLPSATHDWCVL